MCVIFESTLYIIIIHYNVCFKNKFQISFHVSKDFVDRYLVAHKIAKTAADSSRKVKVWNNILKKPKDFCANQYILCILNNVFGAIIHAQDTGKYQFLVLGSLCQFRSI